MLYDRSEEPTAPSWNHIQEPVWSPQIMQEKPWVPATYRWMAGQQPQSVGGGVGDAEVAGLIGQLHAVADDETAALRAAYKLGRQAGGEVVSELLTRLETVALNLPDLDELETTKHARQRAVAEESMLGTALAAFGVRGVEQVCAAVDGAGSAHHKALLLDCLTDTAGALRSTTALECCVRSLTDPSDWVRHNAMQGLELAGAAARPYVDAITDMLEDSEPFVSFAAVSTLFNTLGIEDGTEDLDEARLDLLPLLAQLEGHSSDLVSW